MKKQGQTWVVKKEESATRLDKWLAAAERLASRSRALDALAKGKVFLDDIEQSTADSAKKLDANQIIRIWMDRPGSAERRYTERHSSGLHLIYEDTALLVINKPAGLLSVPLTAPALEPSLLDQVKTHLRSHRKLEPQVVHRIDRDTSGLVVFAKSHLAQRKLKEQFEKHDAVRIYLAVIYGHPDPEAGIWRDRLVWDQNALKQRPAGKKDKHVQEAVSRYRVMEQFAETSLIEVSLVTGKRNQIRIQAGLRGHPLVGEKIYVYENAPARRIEFGRQALHAYRLKFNHPTEGRALSFEAPLPDDFERLLQRLR